MYIGITGVSNGGATLAMPRSEMGQGIHTALPMLVAAEPAVPASLPAAGHGARGSGAVRADGVRRRPTQCRRRTVHQNSK